MPDNNKNRIWSSGIPNWFTAILLGFTAFGIQKYISTQEARVDNIENITRNNEMKIRLIETQLENLNDNLVDLKYSQKEAVTELRRLNKESIK